MSEEKSIFRLQNHHCDLTKLNPGCLNSWPHHCYNFVSFPMHLSSKLIHKQACPCLQASPLCSLPANCSGNGYSVSRNWRCMISIIKHLSRASSQRSAKKEMSHLKCKWASSPQTDEGKTPGVESFHSSLSSKGGEWQSVQALNVRWHQQAHSSLTISFRGVTNFHYFQRS